MKVLHIIPDLAPATGGPVTSVLGLARAQTALGHEVSIASTDWGMSRRPSLEGVHFHLFPCRYDSWRWAPALGKFLRREIGNYDVATVESLWQYPTYIAGRACREAGTPYVVSTNGMLDEWSLAQKSWKKRPYLRFVERATLEGAAAVHLTSRGESEHSHLESFRIRKLIIPLGVHSSSYRELPDRASFVRRYPELEGKRIILFLGRLHFKKQPDVAIKAFHKAHAGNGDARLVLAGGGDPDYVKSLRRLVEDLGMRRSVLFTGLLQGDAVKEAYRAATVFILPSWQENFGLSVVEAMAAGCPVLVSNHIDLASEIEGAGAGLSVAPSVEDNAAALDYLLNDGVLRARLGEAGRKLVLEKFTWEQCARSFMAAFEDILSGRGISPVR
jgi:glycosyltransferase involved in cell wall biosynthesis